MDPVDLLLAILGREDVLRTPSPPLEEVISPQAPPLPLFFNSYTELSPLPLVPSAPILSSSPISSPPPPFPISSPVSPPPPSPPFLLPSSSFTFSSPSPH